MALAPSPVTAAPNAVAFYRGYLTLDESDTAPVELIKAGVVQPEKDAPRAVAALAAIPAIHRVFYDTQLPAPHIEGVGALPIPRVVLEVLPALKAANAELSEPIFYPDTFPGFEMTFRSAGVKNPILVVSAEILGEMTAQQLAALTAIAGRLEGQILRITADTWQQRVETDKYFSIQY